MAAIDPVEIVFKGKVAPALPAWLKGISYRGTLEGGFVIDVPITIKSIVYDLSDNGFTDPVLGYEPLPHAPTTMRLWHPILWSLHDGFYTYASSGRVYGDTDCLLPHVSDYRTCMHSVHHGMVYLNGLDAIDRLRCYLAEFHSQINLASLLVERSVWPPNIKAAVPNKAFVIRQYALSRGTFNFLGHSHLEAFKKNVPAVWKEADPDYLADHYKQFDWGVPF